MTVGCCGNGANDGFADISAIYEEERKKRQRVDGTALTQYVELKDLNDKLSRLNADPFVDHAALNAQPTILREGDEVKVLVLGAGLAALIAWVRFVQANLFKPEDMCVVDQAGGFGGVWYWNRFPGLMCDTMSYLYLPLLEEMGYMPKHRYAHGSEILGYANRIAESWGASERAMFRTTVKTKEWDERSRRWVVDMVQDRGPDEEPVRIKVRSQFVIWAGGLFSFPKVPRLEGMEDFRGTMIHTCRWDYNLSGGTHADPELTKFRGKKVGIVGTGATAAQLVPELAKWAGQLFVFQRTPASVNERGQAPTDEKWFAEVSSRKGWARDLGVKWMRYYNRYPDAEPTLHDGWMDLKGFLHFVGSYHEKSPSPEEVPDLVEDILQEDLEHQDRLRRRVDAIVDDPKTAAQLKPWYPSWCKRPIFHDDYLSAFNLPNVTLVDTAGKGVSSMTSRGIVANSTEYDLDFVIFSTGSRVIGSNHADPSLRAGISIKGKGGLTISEKWSSKGPSSLHSAFVNGFPNLIFLRVEQSAVSPNTPYGIDIIARHVAHVLSEAFKRVDQKYGTVDGSVAAKRSADARDTMTIEATAKAEDDWVEVLLSDAAWASPLGVCGPSYANLEGTEMTDEDKMRSVRSVAFMRGCIAFEELLEAWRAEGSLKGLVIS